MQHVYFSDSSFRFNEFRCVQKENRENETKTNILKDVSIKKNLRSRKYVKLIEL